MDTLRIELDHGFGWQVRSEGEIPADTSADVVADMAARSALNGPVKAYRNGALVFECAKLTKKQIKALYGF